MTRANQQWIVFVVIIVIFYVVMRIWSAQQPVVVTPVTEPAPVVHVTPVTNIAQPIDVLGEIGKRTKTDECVAKDGLPDKACTPGAVFTTATKEQICVSGYSATVRNVPGSLKDDVYAEYGIMMHVTGEYEVDHHVSLELGGSNDIANLWPEPAEPRPGFHEKDKVENWLHKQVCTGAMMLSDAQKMIANDWLVAYQKMLATP